MWSSSDRARGARWPGVVVLWAAVALPGGLAGQVGQTCDVVIDRTGGVGRQVDIGGNRYRLYQSGGVWAHCRAQATTMYADSVAYYPEFSRFDMVGNVRFQDSTAELTAERASYLLTDERLDAYGNARLRNRTTGSLLTGPAVSYRRRMPGVRDTSELTAARRPTIEYRSATAPDAEPYVIVAERVRLVGNAAAWAGGQVTIDRSDFHATADSAELDTDVGRGRLVGHARATGSDSSGYTLSGREISYRLTDGALTWVQAERLADATSADWRITADTVQFDLAADRIQGGSAWGDSTRPRAMSAMNTITGDSLQIVSPGQQLALVRAFGTARATAKRDSLDGESDWVAGDTVTAVFDTTTTGPRGLARIEARGNGRTRYRVYNEDGRTLAGINYSRGDFIIARFVAERLDKVNVIGNADGVFLEARRPGAERGRRE